MDTFPDADIYDADGAVAPSAALSWREWLSAAEVAMAWLALPSVDHWPHGDGHPVIVYPGFLGSASSTYFLRRLLRKLGYAAYDWEQGCNLGLRENMALRAEQQLQDIHERHGRRVSLIGWSAGGVYAREIARRHPDCVRSVITLGSPIRGNYKASRSWWLWNKLHPRSVIEAEFCEAARAARAEPLPVPTTCIFSRLDGVVPWACCTSVPAPQTENVEVLSSHAGFGHNLETLQVIADRLALPEHAWRPYRHRDIPPIEPVMQEPQGVFTQLLGRRGRIPRPATRAEERSIRSRRGVGLGTRSLFNE
jgi:pimeloyl-ACP methyl ester carboxylesterase